MLPGYFAKNCCTTAKDEGELIVLLNTTTLPTPTIASATALSMASKVASFPSIVGKRNLAPSYKSKTEACTLALVPPLVTGDNSFPSILIGLPSRTFATTLTTSPSCT